MAIVSRAICVFNLIIKTGAIHDFWTISAHFTNVSSTCEFLRYIMLSQIEIESRESISVPKKISFSAHKHSSKLTRSLTGLSPVSSLRTLKTTREDAYVGSVLSVSHLILVV